jgi:NADH-quinone oxidoreductase subunit K
MIGLHHYLVLAAVLFTAGLAVVVLKRNALGVLMGVELMLNGANVNLVAFNHFGFPGSPTGGPRLDGQVFAAFVVVVAAAEAAIALAIFLNFYRHFRSIDIDRGTELKESAECRMQNAE